MLATAFLLVLSFSVKAQTSQTFNATNTFTPAAGVTTITVECWGGGGAGGACNKNKYGGGGGGGGGGFSKSSIAVSTSTTYDVTVGAGGIGAGNSGGDSWFNTSGTIHANGGSGGESSSSGLGAASGIGGATGIGTVVHSGGKGGFGSDSDGIKTGHGGPGGSSAGTAANGTSGTNLWTTEIALGAPLGAGKGGDGGNENTNSGNGNLGSIPGGGGGGSGDKSMHTPGNGGDGQVIITYTCPTYNLTSTTATDICTPGSTSIVTLTASAAGLPVGNYAITYDRSSPSGTGLTATMTVATAGSGTFTATGFTTVGNSIITITKLTSQGCSSAISTSNTATIVVSPIKPSGAGAITGTASVCKGATGIIYNVPAIANATSYAWTLPTGASITAGANTNSITVSFDATAISGNITVSGTNVCGNGTVSPNYSVAVNPLLMASVSIAASPSGAICAGTSVTFTATPNNGGITPTYIWKNGGVVIPLQTNSTFTSSTLADKDKITVEMTSNASCATGSPATSNEITIDITPAVGIPVFTMGATSARDQGVGPFTYTATASNSTEITYSLDAASLAGGNTIDPLTGKINYVALWSWKSIITATATGCNGSKTANHVVGVNWCYALFTANGALSCAGASKITGNVGTFVGATTGFTIPTVLLPPGHIDAEASTASAQAAAQAVAVYNDLAAIPSTENHLLPEITLAGPKILTPNVFYYEGALTISGDITLDGGPNDVFIFKINGALTTNTGSHIIMTGGASFRNVYWRVYGAVVLSGAEFKGTIVNEGAFTVNTGAALEGRALSINGAIAITDNVITSDCYPLFSVPDNTKPIFVPPADIVGCVENLSSAIYNPVTIDINPGRPDYYTFSETDTRLDLNTALFTDDEPLTCIPIKIHWRIDFSPVPDPTPPHALVTKPSISGTGQPSDYIGSISYPSDVLFPGDGVDFNPVIHHITWWIEDCAGNESPPQTRSITVNPRPNIIKTTL